MRAPACRARACRARALVRSAEAAAISIHSILTGLALEQEYSVDEEQYWLKIQSFVAELKRLPVAINTSDANEQHYEVCDLAE